MTTYLKKSPTLIVIGITGFVAYAVMFPDGDPGAPKNSTRPPAKDKVETSIAANTLRNPFQMARPVEAASSPTARPAEAQARPPGGLANAGRPNELPSLPAEEDAVLVSMKLVGTFVDSLEQLAIIDNKVYSRGDQLRGADGATLPYVVTEIRKDRTLVRRGRRDFVIAFSDVPRTAGPRAISPPRPAEAKAPTRADAVAGFVPVDGSKKGQAAGTGKPDGNDANGQKALLLQLLSTFGGAPGGGSGPAGSNPLAGLGSGSCSGPNSSGSNALVNPTTLGAGLDAIMGKGDNVGRGGAAGP